MTSVTASCWSSSPGESENHTLPPEEKAAAHSPPQLPFQALRAAEWRCWGGAGCADRRLSAGSSEQEGGGLQGAWVGWARPTTSLSARRGWSTSKARSKSLGDGETGKVACWVRRISASQFQVFAINCAHLGCPVRWFSESKLFMCPCHGGAYYEDGDRASGPPERGLFEYKYRS